MERGEAGRLLCDLLSGRKIPEARLKKLSPADGESLAGWALRFKVAGLLYRETKSCDFPTGLISAAAGNRLRDAYRRLATKNTSLFLDAIKVLKTLADNQVPVIALKGLSLAKSVYGDIALRPMNDMDLLVKEQDLVRAGRILLAFGYRQGFPAWESLTKAYHHLPPFTNKSGTKLELHRNIVTPDTPIRVDLDGLWERACPIQFADVEGWTLSPEDSFLHICIHAGFHLRTGLDLIPFCDMAGLIRTSAIQIDWKIVIERAVRWRGQKCVYLMLLLVRELLGAAPPDRYISELEPADYQSAYFDEAVEQIFDVNPSERLMIKRIDKLSRIKNVKGIEHKARAFLKGAFPPRLALARAYSVSASSPKVYLCYVFRLGRLFVYFMSVLLRFLRRDQTAVKAVQQEPRLREVSDWVFS